MNEYKTNEYYLSKWFIPFKETGNPLYAWRAFLIARRLGLPVQEEVLKYLDGVAQEITKIADNPPKAKNRPVALAKALNLNKDASGQGSFFTDYLDRWKRKIAMEAFFRYPFPKTITDTPEKYEALKWFNPSIWTTTPPRPMTRK